MRKKRVGYGSFSCKTFGSFDWINFLRWASVVGSFRRKNVNDTLLRVSSRCAHAHPTASPPPPHLPYLLRPHPSPPFSHALSSSSLPPPYPTPPQPPPEPCIRGDTISITFVVKIIQKGPKTTQKKEVGICLFVCGERTPFVSSSAWHSFEEEKKEGLGDRQDLEGGKWDTHTVDLGKKSYQSGEKIGFFKSREVHGHQEDEEQKTLFEKWCSNITTKRRKTSTDWRRRTSTLLKYFIKNKIQLTFKRTKTKTSIATRKKRKSTEKSKKNKKKRGRRKTTAKRNKREIPQQRSRRGPRQRERRKPQRRTNKEEQEEEKKRVRKEGEKKLEKRKKKQLGKRKKKLGKDGENKTRQQGGTRSPHQE